MVTNSVFYHSSDWRLIFERQCKESANERRVKFTWTMPSAAFLRTTVQRYSFFGEPPNFRVW